MDDVEKYLNLSVEESVALLVDQLPRKDQGELKRVTIQEIDFAKISNASVPKGNWFKFGKVHPLFAHNERPLRVNAQKDRIITYLNQKIEESVQFLIGLLPRRKWGIHKGEIYRTTIQKTHVEEALRTSTEMHELGLAITRYKQNVHKIVPVITQEVGEPLEDVQEVDEEDEELEDDSDHTEDDEVKEPVEPGEIENNSEALERTRLEGLERLVGGLHQQLEVVITELQTHRSISEPAFEKISSDLYRMQIIQKLQYFVNKPDDLATHIKKIVNSNLPNDEKDKWADTIREILEYWTIFKPDLWQKIGKALAGVLGKIIGEAGSGLVSESIKKLAEYLRN